MNGMACTNYNIFSPRVLLNTFSAKVQVHSYLASSTFSAQVWVHSYPKPNSNFAPLWCYGNSPELHVSLSMLTWPIVKNNLLDDDQRGISLYIDTVHSVLPARTAHGQLFRHYFADIVTEFFKYSVQTTIKTSMFLDKHSINKPVQRISCKYLYSSYFCFTAENPWIGP
jgi:hypothetical protein